MSAIQKQQGVVLAEQVHDYVALMSYAQVAGVIRDFVSDAIGGTTKRNDWGCADMKAPEGCFDAAFKLLMTDPTMVDARYKGVYRMVLEEIEDEDDQDAITLVAVDEDGTEYLEQKLVFKMAL